MRRNLVYQSIDGKKIIFDDFVDNTEEYNSYWVGMCTDCYNKYKGILGNRADDCGSGCCSVCGCSNEADYYVDFDMNEVEFVEDVSLLVDLAMEQREQM